MLYSGYRRSAAFKHRIRRLLSPAGWFVFAGVVVSGGFAIDTDQAMAYQTVSLLGAALAVGALWHFRSQPQLELMRELPRYASAGSKLVYRVRIRNSGRKSWSGLSFLEDCGDPRPSLAQFLQTPEPAEHKRNAFDRAFGYYRWVWLVDQNRRAWFEEVALPTLHPRSETELTVELMPLRRGPLLFERAEIASRDPLGLWRRLSRVHSTQSVLVLPKRYHIPPVALPGTSEYQKGGVALASSVGESEEFVSLREYRRGDPLRHIHWKSSARTGELLVKEFQDEYFVRHAMVLDTFQDGQLPEVFEEAVSVAASFACSIRDQDSLLDLLFVGPQAYCFTAGRGLGQTEQLMEVLASVGPCREKRFSALDSLVIEHLPLVSGAICILVAWDEARQEFVRKIRNAGVPLLVILITEAGQADEIDPGPMRDYPEHFRVLETGKVAEGLLK